MSFHMVRENGISVVTVNQKRATADIAREFKEFLFSAIEQDGVRSLVIDLAGVQFIDSFFLGALVSAYKKLSSEGGKMKLASLHRSLVPVFEIMSLHQVFEILPSREEALSSFS